MKKILFALLFIFGITTSAAASDIDILREFTTSLRAKDYDSAERYVTERSKPWFDCYRQQDLGDLTPASLTLKGSTKQGNYRYLKVIATNTAGRQKMMTVAMTTEQGSDKVDVPESLRLGFGPNWQQRVNMIEQSYIFSKQQFGEQQSMNVLNSLLAK